VRMHERGEKVRLVVDTNAHRLDEEMIALIKELDLGLQISLDGPAEVHDRYRRTRGGEPTFGRIMENLDALLEAVPGIHERVNFVCTLAPPVDMDVVEEFWDAFPLFRRHGIGADPVLTVNVADLRGQEWDGAEKGHAEIRGWMGRASERYVEAVRGGRKDEVGLFLRVLVERPLRKMHERTDAVLGETFTPGANCVPGQRKLMVSVDGEFEVCEKMGQGAGIGDVYLGIDRGAVKELGERFFEEVGKECAGCWALRLCGVCFAGWWGEREEGVGWKNGMCDRLCRGVLGDLGGVVRVLEAERSRDKLLRVGGLFEE